METIETISKRKMYVEEEIKVRTYDTDYMQIVNNTVYVKWFENLRLAILDKYFPLNEMLLENKTPIIAEAYVKYIRPITLRNKPVGKAWVEGMGKSKWIICFEIWEDGILYCEGRQEGYYFDMTSNRPTRFPQHFIDSYNEI